MAKIVGPLFSNSAHGSVDRALTFSSRHSGEQVRFQKKQPDYENTARKTVRDAYSWGIVLWNSLPADEKAYWTEIERKGYADV